MLRRNDTALHRNNHPSFALFARGCSSLPHHNHPL